MKTKKEHLESLQIRYIRWRRFMWIAIGIVPATVILFMIIFYHRKDIVISDLIAGSIIIGLAISFLFFFFVDLSKDDAIDKVRVRVRKRVALLKREVSGKQSAFQQITEGIIPSEFSAEQIADLNELHKLQNKLYKEQAYLQMIGGE